MKNKNKKLTLDESQFMSDLLTFSEKIINMINSETEVELASEGVFKKFKEIVIIECEKYPNIDFNKMMDIFITYQDAKKKLLETVHKIHDLI